MKKSKLKISAQIAMMLFIAFTIFSCGGKKDKDTVTLSSADKVVKGPMRAYFEVVSTSCVVQDGKSMSYIMVELKRTATPFEFDVKQAKEQHLVGFGAELLDNTGAVVATQAPTEYVSELDTDGKTDQSKQIEQALDLAEGETVTILIPLPTTENVKKFRITSSLNEPEAEEKTTETEAEGETPTGEEEKTVKEQIDDAKKDLNNDEDIKEAKKALKQTKDLLDASKDVIDAIQ